MSYEEILKEAREYNPKGELYLVHLKELNIWDWCTKRGWEQEYSLCGDGKPETVFDQIVLVRD